jgi:glycosyltransferase involved in cell wall biosynthesis
MHRYSLIKQWLRFKKWATEAVYVPRTILFRTDVKRWQKVAQGGAPSWDERNKCIADLIPANSSVLDLGAGPQTLRKHLDLSCVYQPCDVVKSSDDVLLCDFNAGIYPQIEHLFDFVVCSGVLEYMRDPLAFIDIAAALGHRMILTYAPARDGDKLWTRMAEGWVNHLRQEELEKLLDKLGLQWIIVEQWHNQVVYKICRSCNDTHAGV